MCQVRVATRARGGGGGSLPYANVGLVKSWLYVEQVPAIVLLKTVVILTISGRRQEKTVGIKSSYFKYHYYEL